MKNNKSMEDIDKLLNNSREPDTILYLYYIKKIRDFIKLDDEDMYYISIMNDDNKMKIIKEFNNIMYYLLNIYP